MQRIIIEEPGRNLHVYLINDYPKAMKVADERIFKLVKAARAAVKRKEKLNHSMIVSSGNDMGIEQICIHPAEEINDDAQTIRNKYRSSTSLEGKNKVKAKESGNHLPLYKAPVRARGRSSSISFGQSGIESGINIAVYNEHSKLTHLQEKIPVANKKQLPMYLQNFYMEGYSGKENNYKGLRAEVETLKKLLFKADAERAVMIY